MKDDSSRAPVHPSLAVPYFEIFMPSRTIHEPHETSFRVHFVWFVDRSCPRERQHETNLGYYPFLYFSSLL